MRVAIILVLVSSGLLAYLGADPRDAVQVRNALIANAAHVDHFTWSPDDAPADFQWTSATQDEFFADAIAGLALTDQAPLAVAKRISNHLLAAPRQGGAIQRNPYDTYREIQQGLGYCADFTLVFSALGESASLQTREWGMSFENFSGKGHAFNEFYALDQQQWVMFDSFYSLYFADPKSDRPLSYIEVNQRLRRPDYQAQVDLVVVNPSQFRFKSEAAAIEYYRDGINGAFLIWSNNFLDIENTAVMKTLRLLPLRLQQLAAIALGVYPDLVILRTESNGPLVERLATLKYVALTALAMLIGGMLLLLVTFARHFKGHRAEPLLPKSLSRR